MSGSGHEPWEEAIPAHLLGALEPSEAAALEGHLAGCGECRARLRWLRPAADLLPESVERFEPPPTLRKRILEQARSEPGADARAGRGALFGRALLGRRPLAGLAAAALIAAVIVGYAIRGGSDGDRATMVETGRPPAVTARMTSEGDSGMLRLAGLHRLPGGMVLEAWVRREGDVSPAGGLFLPDRSGRAMTTIPHMAGVEAVMVTAEPRGGSRAPTSAPMVTVSMSG
jgi:anti-sigma-K factor RskA